MASVCSSFNKIFSGLLLIISSAAAQPVDYNLPGNWMCHPMKPTDASKLPMQIEVQLPDLSVGTVLQYNLPVSNTGVDVFYVYPTIDLSLTPGNTLMNNIDTTNAKTIFRTQAGLSAQFGRVFVPYYRQATLGTYLFASKPTQANNIEFAYNDVEDAFQHYLNNYNNGNKIILIGHSQGTGHVTNLLRKLFDNNPALQSKLIVAVLGGMAFFVEKDSINGGILENIPLCPPLSTGYVCGCAMPWQSFKDGPPIAATYANSPIFNPNITSKGLQYSTFDPLKHEERYFDFGYQTTKNLTRYIYPKPGSSIYLGYENMYEAYNKIQTSPATGGLMVKNIQLPGDLRTDPLAAATSGLHNYDMQIVQGDLLQILQDMITYCSPVGTHENEFSSDRIDIFPNPSSGIFTIELPTIHPVQFSILNVFGEIIYSGNIHDASEKVIDLSTKSSGIYLLEVKKGGELFYRKILLK